MISCAGPHENLIVQNEKVTSKYLLELSELEGKEVQNLGWSDAVDRLLSDNLELKRSRESIRLAKEQTKQIYWDLVPVVSLRTSLSQALENLGEVDGEDVRFGVFSTLNIPGVISLYSRRYAALLGEIKSALDFELKQRQLIIRLYDLFLAYEDFRLRVESQKKTQMLASIGSKSPIENLQVSPEGLLIEQQLFEEQMKEDQLRQEAGVLLGSFEKKWNLVSEDLPRFNYLSDLPDFNDTKNFGVLLRKKQAMELEAARLSKVVAKLSFFPDLNFGVYTPPLYANWVDNYRFSSDRMIFNASSSVTLDTNFRKLKNLKRIEKQLEFQNLAIKEEINNQIVGAIRAKRELELVEKELALTLLRLEVTDFFTLGSDLKELREFLEKRYLLIQRASGLRMRKAKIEGGFWLLDERRWRNPQMN